MGEVGDGNITMGKQPKDPGGFGKTAWSMRSPQDVKRRKANELLVIAGNDGRFKAQME